MKLFRRLLFVLLTITLTLTLFACGGCKNHADTNGDGLCEACGEEAELKIPEAKDLTLIQNNEALFQIVLEDGIDSNAKMTVKRIADTLEEFGMTVNIVEDKAENIQDCEILIGQVKSRGPVYEYDVHSLGMEGQVIKIIGNKLIVAGGSVEQLRIVVKTLLEDIFGITRSTDELPELTVAVEDCFEEIQSDYEITSVKIGANSIRDYTISVPAGDENLLTAATIFRDTLYEKAGIWLAIETDSDKEKLITFCMSEDAGVGGYRVRVVSGNMIVESTYKNTFISATETFAAQKITKASGEVVFTGDVFQKDVRYVYYEDYGAKGDGVTNDIDAIRAAHAFANEGGQTVVALKNKNSSKNTFYIGATGGRTVEIKTSVDWTGATFKVDDTSFEYNKDFEKTASIFTVVRDYETITHSKNNPTELYNELKDGFTKDLDKLEYKTGYKAMYIIYNANRKMYIRNGGTTNNTGAAQHEIIVVDEEGNIDPLTKCLFDYEEVTSIVEYRLDDKPITLKGGTFITTANAAPNLSTYYERNIMVKRSNVTIENLVHEIEDEGEQGSPYHGFISCHEMSNLTVKNCTLQAHKTYRNGSSNMGTYDISCHLANDVYFVDCTQSNFYKPGTTTPMTSGTCWGIMGSNYSKNITFDHCKLSRLDAHAGVYNASIINGSEVTYIRLTGGGKFLVKDSIINAGNTEEKVAISLRADYGSTWNGDIYFENCTIRSGTTLTLIGAEYYYDRYFGYKVYMPQNVVVDGLTVVSTSGAPQQTNIVVFSDLTVQGQFDPTGDTVTIGPDSVENKNPLELNKTITFKNVDHGVTTITSTNDLWLYDQLTVVWEK